VKVGIAKLTVAENKQLLSLSCGNLRQQRKKVIRDTLGVLAHDTAWVGASGVEVAQKCTVPLGSILALLCGLVTHGVNPGSDHLLDSNFGVAICVGWAKWADLRDGDHVGEAGSIAIDGSRRGEDNVSDIVLLHRSQQAQTAVHIDTVVLKRNFAGLTNSL
jgi:hypothetical protein